MRASRGVSQGPHSLLLAWRAAPDSAKMTAGFSQDGSYRINGGKAVNQKSNLCSRSPRPPSLLLGTHGWHSHPPASPITSAPSSQPSSSVLLWSASQCKPSLRLTHC